MTKLSNLYAGLGIALVAFLSGCTTDKPKPKPPVVIQEQPKIIIPKFSGQNAYDFVQKQVDFGPRVPETEAHTKCAEWLKKHFQTLVPKLLSKKLMSKGMMVKK
jgi:glutaminyl-peptide cyclotransferase